MSRTLHPIEALILAAIALLWAARELLEADSDGLAHRLRLGWTLATPEALAVPHACRSPWPCCWPLCSISPSG